MSDSKNQAPAPTGKGNKKLIAIIAGTSLLVAGSFGVQAVANSNLAQHAKLLITDSDDSYPYFQKANWGGHKGGRHERFTNMSDAEIEKKITRAVKHVSIEIDATTEQETKITALLTAVAKDMKPLHGQFRAAGEEMHKLLLAPSIDRVAMEKIRTERLAEADRVSKELVTAVADVAEVLTVEQRKVLDGRIKQFKSMRKRWHRG